MHYASIKKYDVANGEGIRISLFVSGCPHHCKNCFNKEAWDYDYGNLFTEKEENDILDFLNNDYIKGLSLLGGEPMFPENQKRLIPFLKKVKDKYPDKDIWCYTGYIYDKEIINDMCKKNDFTKEFLSYIDVLVDGRFIESKKDVSLFFRGSSNQRIIDIKKSLRSNKVIQIEMKGEGVKIDA